VTATDEHRAATVHLEPEHSTPATAGTATGGDESYRGGALVVLLRLYWFVRLRWIFFAVALAVFLAERYILPDDRQPSQRWRLLATILAVAAINVVWTVLSRGLRRRSQELGDAAETNVRSARLFANAQVAIDLILLTAILHFTGGVENPMSAFYLFHVAIGALLLTTSQAFLQCCLAILLYAGMALSEWSGSLRHYPLLPHLNTLGLYQQPEYVGLSIVVVACAILGVLYFTSRIVLLLDRHQSELMRANAALTRSRQSIADLQTRRARFMQTAAHQLKAPLAITQTLASLVRDGLVTDAAGIQSTCAKIIRRCQDGMAQVSELLTLARVQDADPDRHRVSRTDARVVATELFNRFRPLAESKQINLTCWMPPGGDLIVRVDPRDLRDCISNLLDNAIKYTNGPGRVRLILTAKRGEGYPPTLGIHVSDTGIGIDPKLLRADSLGQEPVFEAFSRGPNAMAAGLPGTGLGLSIVREVVEQAGGRIWVMSRLGIGSSFTITLPLVDGGPTEPLVRNTRSTDVVLEPHSNDGAHAASKTSDAPTHSS
jgi:signal transduction histidine kinase